MNVCLFPLLLVAAAAAGLAGCATPGKLESDQRAQVAGQYRVEPQIEWTRMRWPGLELWTVDGPQLQQLRFYAALEAADILFPEQRQERPTPVDQRRPEYREWMRPHDVMQLVADTIARSGAVKVSAHNLRPAEFGTRSGFRFELTFESRDGLEYRGLALGTIDGERRLHLILYTGAGLHYYEAYREEVERILDSVELL